MIFTNQHEPTTKKMVRKRRGTGVPRSGKTEVCKKCNEPGVVARRDGQGRPTCKKCYDLAYYHDTANHEHCVDCGEVKPVSRRRNGWALCRSCSWKDPIFHEVCFYCDLSKPVARYNSFEQPVCYTCTARGCGGPSIYRGSRVLEIRGITPNTHLFRRFDLTLQVA
jgi:hypothetical protein